MAELQQLRVQEVVDSMVKSLERENIRKMQGLMFRCSAGCCEDSQASSTKCTSLGHQVARDAPGSAQIACCRDQCVNRFDTLFVFGKLGLLFAIMISSAGNRWVSSAYVELEHGHTSRSSGGSML
ncbi:hypothetical protein EI555_013227 [Monodon monoceros]|uniref:Protein FAM136A n=1 Tax=Monodon monoceros TaxID=40151 RepID=A0A4U1FNN1_MONMO|nr:hypothetical protein EI555_013227 [Monodon monoceros]